MESEDIPTFTYALEDFMTAPTATSSPHDEWAKGVAQSIAQSINDDQRMMHLESLTPHIVAFTFAVLGCSLLRWPPMRLLLRAQITTMAVWLVCGLLSWPRKPMFAILAASLAVGYVVWITMPGSLDTGHLPTHREFMRSLKLTPQAEREGTDCMICWSSEHPLAKLPCGHQTCTGCLQLMGTQRRTGCPLCREPIFSGDECLAFYLQKGRVILIVVGAVLYGVTIAYRLRTKEYKQALGAVLAFLPTTVSMGWLVYERWKAYGEHWWRETGTTGIRGLHFGRAPWHLPAFTFGCALVTTATQWATICSFAYAD